MLTNLKKRTEGFTIIEVLIVLAIAGLIMLIVFLAVPALQRNSRNTQRKNDVSALLGAVNEYANNNAGKLPADATVFKGGSSGGTTTPGVISNAKLGYYDVADVGYETSVTTGAPAVGVDKVTIIKGAKCGSAPTDSPLSGSSRQFVAWYSVETGSGSTGQCQEG